MFALVGTIQEETHRSAIEYQRSLRSAALRSGLEDIPTSARSGRADLLRSFGTVKAVKAAGYEQLCAVVPKNAARAVYGYFHPDEEGQI